ncbi:hypothetical protein ACIPUB_20030 [Paeniglutamicibacter sp. ORCA_105]|uniref:hypothetical protein n=1 Tax=Paeniglutamicibacter sp. ORCA_105 TaxID=3377336 RepID=UPI0038958AF8
MVSNQDIWRLVYIFGRAGLIAAVAAPLNSLAAPNQPIVIDAFRRWLEGHVLWLDLAILQHSNLYRRQLYFR